MRIDADPTLVSPPPVTPAPDGSEVRAPRRLARGSVPPEPGMAPAPAPLDLWPVEPPLEWGPVETVTLPARPARRALDRLAPVVVGVLAFLAGGLATLLAL